MWQLYRMVLGRDEIPAKSLLDKAPLTWRLMRLLPQVIDRPHLSRCNGSSRTTRIYASATSCQSAWQICLTSTKCIGLIGSRTGPKAGTSCAMFEVK